MKACVRCGTQFATGGWTCPSCGYAPEAGDILRFSAAGHPEAFSADSFHDLTTVEPTSAWFDHRSKLIVWALGRYLPKARTLLEVGCGTGVVLRALRAAYPALTLAGGELGAAGLAIARERLPGVPLYALDAGRLPFADEFDALGAFDVLEHIGDDAGALASFRGALRPGGGLLLTVPQHPRLWSPLDEYAGHRRRYTRHGLVALLARSGFRVVHATSFVSLPLPALAVSRLVERRQRLDPVREHRRAAALGGPLAAILALERVILRRGVPLPAGGSLLVVARRDDRP